MENELHFLIVDIVPVKGSRHRIWREDIWLIDAETGDKYPCQRLTNISEPPVWTQYDIPRSSFQLWFEKPPASARRLRLEEIIPEPGGLSLPEWPRDNPLDLYQFKLHYYDADGNEIFDVTDYHED